MRWLQKIETRSQKRMIKLVFRGFLRPLFVLVEQYCVYLFLSSVTPRAGSLKVNCLDVIVGYLNTSER